MHNVTEQDLKTEIADIRERFPRLPDSDLFVTWFLKSFVTEKEDEAIAALVGGPRDKSLDAIFVDESAKKVFVVQGKYRQRLGGGTEHRSDVTAFADLAHTFSDNEAFASYVEGLDTAATGKAEIARKRIRNRGYRLQLYYVTTGGCSSALTKEAERIVRQAECSANIDVIDGSRILRLLCAKEKNSCLKKGSTLRCSQMPTPTITCRATGWSIIHHTLRGENPSGRMPNGS